MIKICHQIQIVLLSVICSGISSISLSQTVLDADGPGDTYELINSVFSPGYNAVENPDCSHPDFGRHIAEVWDDDLNQFVFEFYIHVRPDNDRCTAFDRQRNEIKTYDKSPDNLKGVPGETVTYKWKFKIPSGFQPSSSFTHIHQIKAVGGDDGNPIFSLTPRAGSPNKLELIHNNSSKVVTVPLSLFEGVWVEATEKITIDNLHGTYSMTIIKINDGDTLLSYINNNLMTIRADNTFVRPKWGIYRSLNHPEALRDEAMRFAGFSIFEETATMAILKPILEDSSFSLFPNPVSGKGIIEYILPHETKVDLLIYDLNGKIVKSLIQNERQNAGFHQFKFDVSDLKEGFCFVHLKAGTSVKTIKLSIVK